MARRKNPRHIRDFERLNDDETLERVVTDLDASVKNQQTYFDNFQEYYKQYKGLLDESEIKEDRSNLFIPYTASNVETVKAKIINALFRERPLVTTRSLNTSEDAEKMSKRMNSFLQYQLEQKMSIIPKSANIILEMVMYGDAITEQKWNYKTKKIKKKSLATVKGTQSKTVTDTKEVDMVIKDNADIELVSTFDFFFDPASTDIETSSYCIRRKYEDYLSILQDERYKNATKLKEFEEIKFVRDVNDPLSESGINDSGANKRAIEVLHYWTDDWHIVVANRKFILLKEENPYNHREKPFAKWSFLPINGEWYSRGLIELSTHLQAELNTLRNQRVDNVNLIINNMFKARRGSSIQEEELVSRPGGVIWLDELTDLETLKMDDVTSSAYLEEDVIKADFDRVTGVHDMHRGESSGGRETATMASLVDQHGNERFVLNLKLIEFGGFKDAIAQIIQLNQQFIEEDRAFLILGEKGEYDTEQMTMEEIIGEYEIIGVGSSTGAMYNKEVRQNQLTALLGQLTPYRDFINMDELIMRVLEVYEIQEPGKIVKTQEQVDKRREELQQEELALQQQAQMQAQGQQQQTQPAREQGMGQQAQMQAQGQQQGQGLGQGQGQGQNEQMQLVQNIVQILSKEITNVDPAVLQDVVIKVMQGEQLPKEVEPLREVILKLANSLMGGGAPNGQ